MGRRDHAWNRLFGTDSVRHDGCHSVGSAVAIRAGGLGFAGIGTPIRISDKRVLDIRSADGSSGVPSAVARAESRTLSYVRRGQHEVNAIGIIGQAPAGDRAGDYGLNTGVSQPRSAGVIIKGGLRKLQTAAHVTAVVAIGGVDSFVARSSNTTRAEQRIEKVNCGLTVRGMRTIGPVAVPDEVNRNWIGFHHGAAVIRDSIACDDRI